MHLLLQDWVANATNHAKRRHPGTVHKAKRPRLAFFLLQHESQDICQFFSGPSRLVFSLLQQ
jgi:hypothetical protein